MTKTSETSLGFFNTLIKFIQEGGPFMYVILLVFTVGLAIAIDRFIYLHTVKIKNRSTWDTLFPLFRQGQFHKAYQLAQTSDAAIAKILIYGLDRSSHTNQHDEIELAMEEGLMEIIPRLEQRTPYLATFANIATLLGLLGTIMGLISAFTAISSADPAQKADLLSASISVAMNTTALGLITAIPLLLIFSILQSMTTQIIDSMEMASVKFLNTFKHGPKTKPE